MPTYHLPFASDNAFGGIPPGDQGRTSGKWFDSGDFGNAMFAVDGTIALAQGSDLVQPRLRFAPSASNIAELITLLGGGTIFSVTPVAVHRRQPVTTNDTAPVPVAAIMERPSNTNVTTIWNILLSSLAYITEQGPAILTEPAGGLWTPALLLATAFSLQMQPNPVNGSPYLNQYLVDQYYLSVDYETACVPFPMPTVGGAAGCSGTLGTTVVGGAHGGPV